MKIFVTIKDPDALFKAARDAIKSAPKPEGISKEEYDLIRDAREENPNTAGN